MEIDTEMENQEIKGEGEKKKKTGSSGIDKKLFSIKIVAGIEKKSPLFWFPPV